MQDRTPAEMLTDNNPDNQDEEFLDQGVEVEEGDEEDDEEEDFEEEDSSEPQPEKSFDPVRQIQNLTQVSHESNDSHRRRRKRAKVDKIKNRGGKKKRR